MRRNDLGSGACMSGRRHVFDRFVDGHRRGPTAPRRHKALARSDLFVMARHMLAAIGAGLMLLAAPTGAALAATASVSGSQVTVTDSGSETNTLTITETAG